MKRAKLRPLVGGQRPWSSSTKELPSYNASTTAEHAHEARTSLGGVDAENVSIHKCDSPPSSELGDEHKVSHELLALCGTLTDEVNRFDSGETSSHAEVDASATAVDTWMHDHLRDRVFAMSRYRSDPESFDFVFEALCVTHFDDIFKHAVGKFQHGTHVFEAALAPFLRAGAVHKFVVAAAGRSGCGKGPGAKSTTRGHRRARDSIERTDLGDYSAYITRFRTRRYSYKHKVNRSEGRGPPSTRRRRVTRDKSVERHGTLPTPPCSDALSSPSCGGDDDGDDQMTAFLLGCELTGKDVDHEPTHPTAVSRWEGLVDGVIMHIDALTGDGVDGGPEFLPAAVGDVVNVDVFLNTFPVHLHSPSASCCC